MRGRDQPLETVRNWFTVVDLERDNGLVAMYKTDKPQSDRLLHREQEQGFVGLWAPQSLAT